MKIWILARRENFEQSNNLRFLETAEKMKIDARLIAPEEVDLVVSGADEPKVFLCGEEVELPDCVLPRTGSGSNYFALAVLRQLHELGVPIINSEDAIERAKDKLATMQLLAAASIPVPKTMLARPPLCLDFVDRQFDYPLILKTISGSYGRGVFRVQNRQMLDDIAGLIEESAEGGRKSNIILQEYISGSEGKDIRVIVVGGRPIGAMLRTARPGSYKSNVAAGGSVQNYPLTPEIEWLAVEATRVIGLEISGVDILFDGENYKICEVNSAPQFEGFERATEIDVPAEVFNFLRVRLAGVEN